MVLNTKMIGKSAILFARPLNSPASTWQQWRLIGQAGIRLSFSREPHRQERVRGVEDQVLDKAKRTFAQ